MTKEKQNPVDSTQELDENLKELILFNDDVNTFEFVIETLVDVCGHNPHQAEQCTMVVHYNGKCAVKSGTAMELKPVHDEMCNRKLSVSIN